MAQAVSPKLQTSGSVAEIARISVQNLFGAYTYVLETPHSTEPDAQRLLIIYGDNGSGKTTLLRLLFNMLSSARNRGHRTFIARVPLSKIEDLIRDVFVIGATRSKGILTGPYSLEVKRDNQVLASTRFDPDRDNRSSFLVDPNEKDPLNEVLAHLESAGPQPYFLADDRTVHSDALEDEMNLRPSLVRSYGRDYFVPIGDETPERLDSRDEALRQALGKAAAWVRQHAIQASTVGASNANAIYSDVIKKIARYSGNPSEEEIEVKALEIRLLELEKRSADYARFGLAATFPVVDLLKAIRGAPLHTHQLIANVLTPHLDGAQARLDALSDVHKVVATLVRNLNEFMSDKSVDFDLRGGIGVKSRLGDQLQPESLSSGEKQLLLLLSRTLSARDQASLFIIDEPELSLNVKWQRGLVNTLLECTEGTFIQFVLATHSVELLSSHVDRVLELSAAGS